MNYVRTHNRRQQVWNMLGFEDGSETVSIDYSPWSDDNGNVTACVVTVKTGTATVSNESLAGNTKTFTISNTQIGSSMIQLKATAGNNIDISHIRIMSKDPETITNDYGMIV